MQIPSGPTTTATTPPQTAVRPVVGVSAPETRSTVMPAVQQPSESQASADRRNPAGRAPLADERVRLYGPFPAIHDPVVSDAATPDVTVNDQSQGQQSQQQGGGEKAPDAETAAAASEADPIAVTDGRGVVAAAASTAKAAETGKVQDAGKSRAQESNPAQVIARARAQRSKDAEKQQVISLAGRDREVRAHEAAHASVGGQYAGAPSFSIKQGPDGVNYAIGGEVPIDVSAIPGDPEATIRKMETVQRAALAPSEPSSADHAVAAQAAQTARAARAQLLTNQANARVADAEHLRKTDAEAAQKREGIARRLTAVQNRFDFSATLTNVQRSRQVDLIARQYGPLRAGTIGTLLDETV